MKKVTLFIILFLNLAVSAFAQKSEKDWVGIWTFKNYTRNDRSGELDGTITMDGEFDLCSDHFANVELYLKANFYHEDFRVKYASHIWISGRWEDQNGLVIIADRKMSNVYVSQNKAYIDSDYINGVVLDENSKWLLGVSLENQIEQVFNLDLFLDKNGRFSIADMQKNGLRATKSRVSLPFYNIRPKSGDFTILSLTEVPRQGYVRGVLRDPSTNTFEVGLFLRAVPFQAIYSRKYDASGRMLGQTDVKGFLTAEEKSMESYKVDEYIDAMFCPKDGFATYTFSDGSTYEGTWADGVPSGTGKKSFRNGSWLDGQWENGQFIQGKASNYVHDGGKYTGTWMNGLPSGTGKKTLNDGTWYDGQWENGQFTGGRAYVLLPDGFRYEGEYARGLPNGEGKKTKAGSSYTGTWVDGVLARGSANLVLPSNRNLVCEVVDGHVTGKGTMTAPYGKYEGNWEDKKFKDGTITRTGEYVFTGTADLTNERMYADGELVLRDGSTFNGNWFSGLFREGTILIQTGDPTYPVFDGTWKNNKLDGAFQSARGYSVSGLWDDLNPTYHLTILFPNGDSATGEWNALTWSLIPETTFTYVWADGLKVTYLVNKKLKLTKASYQNADDTPAKARQAKGRTMMNTDGEGYTLQPVDPESTLTKVTKVMMYP